MKKIIRILFVCLFFIALIFIGKNVLKDGKEDLYIDELQELDSEIEDMDTEFKAAAQMVSYSLEKASDNVYIDGMDELITQIEEAKEDGQISPEEIKLAESCIDDYLNIIRPSATTIE